MARPSSSGAIPSLVLFVAGEPESTPGVRQSGVGTLERLAGMVLVGPGVLPKELRPEPAESSPGPDELEKPPLTDERPWHLPPAQMACVQIVLDAAKRQGRGVVVVDVDRPGEHKDLVDRYVGSNDVLPLLVREDGARLEGEERFAPAEVRRFIARR